MWENKTWQPNHQPVVIPRPDLSPSSCDLISWFQSFELQLSPRLAARKAGVQITLRATSRRQSATVVPNRLVVSNFKQDTFKLSPSNITTSLGDLVYPPTLPPGRITAVGSETSPETLSPSWNSAAIKGRDVKCPTQAESMENMAKRQNLELLEGKISGMVDIRGS